MDKIKYTNNKLKRLSKGLFVNIVLLPNRFIR
jgi:hypothetical protein